jgi:CDP-6-deoxy-D-xylo-4-hexulose-3-dehydrase
MSREFGNKFIENKIIKSHKKLSSKFIFLYPAYNFRNNEIAATIGINQLKSLDKNNNIRKRNLLVFLNNLNKSKYRVDFDIKGNCNYAFPLILKNANIKNRDRLEKILKIRKIEFRRGNAGGGNQLRQPYLKKYTKNLSMTNFKEVDHIHFYGYYIGNYPTLKVSKIKKICRILNSIDFRN